MQTIENIIARDAVLTIANFARLMLAGGNRPYDMMVETWLTEMKAYRTMSAWVSADGDVVVTCEGVPEYVAHRLATVALDYATQSLDLPESARIEDIPNGSKLMM